MDGENSLFEMGSQLLVGLPFIVQEFRGNVSLGEQ
jgi:hypothetical protein